MIKKSQACRILHGKATPRCRARVDKEFKGYFAVQFMDAGQVELFYGPRRYLLTEPAFWFCRPGLHIRFHPGPEGWWSHRYLAFAGTLPGQWIRQGLMVLEPVACPVSRIPSFIRRMDEIGKLAADSDVLAPWQTCNSLEALILEIERLRGRRRENTFWADRVGKAWREAMGKPVDYAGLAAENGMALSTFRRLFREETGMGPHQYVQKLRIEEARLRLELGRENQKEIAAALGYADVYHFNHDFRRRAGLPPAHYQSSLLAVRRGAKGRSRA